MKVFRIRQSIAHFDQWKPLISKMPFKLKSNGRPPRLLRFRGRFRSHRGQNFKNHLVFITFHNKIFVVMSFEVVWPRRPRKEPCEYFQRLHFSNQWVPLVKMHYRVRYSLDFDLKIHSGQVWPPNELVFPIYRHPGKSPPKGIREVVLLVYVTQYSIGSITLP